MPLSTFTSRLGRRGVSLSLTALSRGKIASPVRVLSTSVKKYEPIDGNGAAAYVAYAMTDNMFIYPISPATPMGEYVDTWASQGRKNVFGRVPDVSQMQSEGGAAGALHGSVSAGALAATFTASQGLLLMIPNMYLLAGELQPAVFHVAARALARQALSIFNDHSDVMAVRQTGWSILSSHNVQEAMDLGFVAHLSTISSRVPFLHFFDGQRTSHEIQKIHVPSYDEFKELVPWEAVQQHRDRGFNPTRPTTKGTGMRPDTYMQASVASNTIIQAVPAVVEEKMKQVAKMTGRHYKLFDYFGAPDADRVIVVMGSASGVVSETVNYMNNHGHKVGVIKPRLYRPWSTERFLEALPPSASRICVLDRTKEDGALGLPLYLDVVSTLIEAGITDRTVVNGSFGLASKEFTPTNAMAVFENLALTKPKNHFVVGINDDVTHTSLPEIEEPIYTVPPETNQAMFWGTGGDGTIGANKTAIKMICDNTDLWAQGYFAYDSKKQGGVTMSHLRFGPNPILTAAYEITHANYMAVHTAAYMPKFGEVIVKRCIPGATLVINCPWDLAEMTERFSPKTRRIIAKKKLKLYAVDAVQLAFDIGLGKRVNMVMQSVYFHLSGVLPGGGSSLLNKAIEKMYGLKGDKIVNMNKRAVSEAVESLRLISYPENWGQVNADVVQPDLRKNLGRADSETGKFVKNLMDPMLKLQGDELPVSAFVPGNQTCIGTTQYERRIIAKEVPVWKEDTCTQCNYCSLACPHAAIRPFLYDKNENKAKPETLVTVKTKGAPEIAGLNYSIQVAPFGCTGCAICVAACPDDSLEMKDLAPIVDKMDAAWDFAMRTPEKNDKMDKMSPKGSQFQQPLLEFSGACSGCGETPYVKLVTQLFGERMIIANSSGCSSVWGGTYGEIPYAKHKKTGRGPSWGRSLFEDTAEYGMGMHLTSQRLREDLRRTVVDSLQQNSIPGELAPKLQSMLDVWQDGEKSVSFANQILPAMEAHKDANEQMKKLYTMRNYFVKPSQWIIGGDGWAYDIGYGGLDHVLASGANINVLVLDTEMYSNTGGQVSKSSPKGGYAKYAMAGKKNDKKNLGAIAMQYGNVYVASCSLSANWNQTVQALKEAESYEGPSLIIAYATCVDWGHSRGTDAMVVQQREAVESGYWPLYRYDPRRLNSTTGEAALQMDSAKVRLDLQKYLNKENRFTLLQRKDKDSASKMHAELARFTTRRLELLSEQAMDRYELLDKLKASLGEAVGEKVLIAYASETGNAQDLAQSLAFEMKNRGVRVSCKPLNAVDVDALANEKQVIFTAATCGQGEWPANAKGFWADLNNPDLPTNLLQNVKFSVFGLGDTGYVFFNSTAKELDERMLALGAKHTLETALADEVADGGIEGLWDEWKPNLYNHIEADPPPTVLPPESFLVNVVPAQTASKDASIKTVPHQPAGAKIVSLTKAQLMTPVDYDRDIRHFEFDLKGLNMPYEMGDSLGIWPRNKKADVEKMLNYYGLFADDVIQLEDVVLSRPDNPLPKMMTAFDFFEQVLDLFGKPKRRFFEMMQILASDPEEKARLTHLLSGEGKVDMDALAKEEKVTHWHVLSMFPKTRPTIAQLLDYVPDIRPRLYSIASSSRMHGEDKLHLLIVADDWTSPSGEYRHGLCTQFLRALEPRDGAPIKFSARVNPAAVQYPSDLTVPLILSGLGTGLAPLRAAIEERVAARADGEKTGPMALFFGSRHEKQEFPYGDEFKKYHEMGVLTHICTAFSRDQKHKIYVQDRIKEQAKMIYDYLITRNGSFYYCGTGGSAVDSIQAAVEGAFVSEGGMTPKEASDLVMEMRLKGRYCVESW